MSDNVSGLCVVALSKNIKLTTTLDRAITQNPCYVPFFIQIMTVDRKHTEILDRPDQMWAEGTAIWFGKSDKFKPKANEIENLLKAENWLIYDLDIWYDSLQGFWRWSCKIARP